MTDGKLTMDPTHSNHPVSDDAKRLQDRQKEIALRREWYVQSCQWRWHHMLDQWMNNRSGHAFWLMYSASYLVRWAEVGWAVDPVRLKHMVAEAPDVDVSPLSNLSFVLLTHDHKDHVDVELWHRLKDQRIHWVVPQPLVKKFIETTGIQDDRLHIPQPMQPIAIQGLCITPFDGLHWEFTPNAPSGTEPTLGLPSMGYLVQGHSRHWLLPGDTRSYDASKMPVFDDIDVLFAHVWLGRGAALQNSPPLLEPMAQFIAQLKPAKCVILSHLYETSRPASDCWVDCHAWQIIDALARDLPGVPVIAPRYWEHVLS